MNLRGILEPTLDDIDMELVAVTMPGHLAEMRRCESHQTWEASP